VKRRGSSDAAAAAGMADLVSQARDAYFATTGSGAAVVTVATLLLWHWLRQRQQHSKSGVQHTDRRSATAALEKQSGQRVGGSTAAQDAVACWALGIGRYKHCGLRGDPMASTELPVLSRTNIDIPLPELGAERREKVDSLSRRVEDLTELAMKGPGLGGHRTDGSTLVRYLRGNKWNVDKAEEQLRTAASWRQQCDMDQIFTRWDLEAYERCLAPWWLSGGFLGHTRHGQPVALERIGHCHFPNLVKAIPWEVLLRIDVVSCNRLLGALEEDALRRGTPLMPALIIIDVHGFGLDQAQFQAARTLARIVRSRNLLLTEVTDRVLVIRAPPVFQRAWSLFSYLLDPGTRDKFEVAGGAEDSLQVLRKYVDNDLIPEYLGGKLNIGGDPECSLQLAPGGPPPQQAIDRLLELTVRNGVVMPAAKECLAVSSSSRSSSPRSADMSALDEDAKPRCCCGA